MTLLSKVSDWLRGAEPTEGVYYFNKFGQPMSFAEGRWKVTLLSKERVEWSREEYKALPVDWINWKEVALGAMAERDALYEREERLRKALEPFARQEVDNILSLQETDLEREDFHRARAALKETK